MKRRDGANWSQLDSFVVWNEVFEFWKHLCLRQKGNMGINFLQVQTTCFVDDMRAILILHTLFAAYVFGNQFSSAADVENFLH